jgi:hypothetical protein
MQTIQRMGAPRDETGLTPAAVDLVCVLGG